MYQFISKIQKSSLPKFADESAYTILRLDNPKKSLLKKFDLDLNLVKWIAPEENVVSFIPNNGSIIYSLDSGKVIARKESSLDQVDYIFNKGFRFFKKNISKSILFQQDREIGKFFFDLDKGEIIDILSPIHDKANFRFFKSHLLKTNRSVLHCFSLSFKELWELDVSDKAAYFSAPLDKTKSKGRFNKLYEYGDNKLIATTLGSLVLCININTGDIIWELKMPFKTIEIVGDIGYACSGLSLAKIDLRDGSVSGYGWKNHRLPDIPNPMGEAALWPSGYDVVYHEGLLWYLAFTNGRSFILAINPHDGHYEWIHEVQSSNKVMSIKFYQNRMYLHDSGGTLHIYEKE